ncbi:bactofilin family protein [Thiovibrio frasassiensis]|uniref:Polymer-forming cytoskeletal protein n=1 Tax=Thiovibrio frasassiensis TaxID=2984131 RepID=A0A9X4MEY7_9BACT|nr:polymer-forming cytoskeletal protein [Thiovibrio frasassiensis]MDG4475023.1 polymer-forming cytoskeletal protein [Thiovibrio frasassiensis]
MGFFNKQGIGETKSETITSVIGADMQLVGDISFKGKLRLDGKAEGNIRGEYLILGETGMISGDIVVSTFVCSGRVEGTVNVQKLYVVKSGFIEGKVETMDLAVESGAVLNGEIKSRSQELRLVPGAASQEEDWEARMKEAASASQGKKKAAALK